MSRFVTVLRRCAYADRPQPATLLWPVVRPVVSPRLYFVCYPYHQPSYRHSRVATRNPPACVQHLNAWFKEISRPGMYRASTGAICGPYTSILLGLTLAQDWHVPFPSCKQWSSSAPLHTATGAHACTQYVCANAKPCMALTEIGIQKACRKLLTVIHKWCHREPRIFTRAVASGESRRPVFYSACMFMYPALVQFTYANSQFVPSLSLSCGLRLGLSELWRVFTSLCIFPFACAFLLAHSRRSSAAEPSFSYPIEYTLPRGRINRYI